MMLFVSVFEYAWKPFYLSHYDDKDAKQLFARVLTYFTLASAAVFLVTGMFIEYIVQMPFIGGKFIKPEYWVGMGIIPIILGGYFFNGLYNNFAAGFQINKKTEYLPIAIGISAIINIGLNFLLIPVFSYWGAAWATLIAYFCSAVILYLFARKIYPIVYEWKRVGIIISTAIIIYSASMVLTSEMSLSISFLFRMIAIIIFFLLLYAFKIFSPAELRRLKQMLRSKKSNPTN
jgi:O-antigen/teichoic acid export membrane protein